MNSPIFVLGNPRSGTTLLRLMLTCHPAIVIPPEAGFAAWLYERYRDWKADCPSQIDAFVADALRTRKMETWGLGEEDLRGFLREHRPATYPEAVSLVYELYGLRSGREFRRWGDKNNFYIDYIEVLDRMFPDAQFVHIVRDGRNVACSYRALGAQKISSAYAPRLPMEIRDIATEWRRNVDTVSGALRKFGPERGFELRLEDLVRSPEQVLRGLTGFLGEEFDRSMLDYHRIGEERQLEPREFLQWKQRTLEPPIDTRNEIYKSELDAASIASFEETAGDSLRRYGYLA